MCIIFRILLFGVIWVHPWRQKSPAYLIVAPSLKLESRWLWFIRHVSQLATLVSCSKAFGFLRPAVLWQSAIHPRKRRLFRAHNRRQKDELAYDIAMRRVFYTENISNIAKTYTSVSHLDRQRTANAGAISCSVCPLATTKTGTRGNLPKTANTDRR